MVCQREDIPVKSVQGNIQCLTNQQYRCMDLKWPISEPCSVGKKAMHSVEIRVQTYIPFKCVLVMCVKFLELHLLKYP